MNIYRSLAVTRRIFRNLKNDRRVLIQIFVAPIFVMFLFGSAFSSEVQDVHVIVVNNDEGMSVPVGNTTFSVSDKIISNLDTGILTVEYANNVSQAITRVEDGKAYAVIVFPSHFTKGFYAKTQNQSTSINATVEVRADRSNSNVAEAIVKTVNAAVLTTVQDLGNALPITVDVGNSIYGQNAKYIDFFVPGIMTFAVYQLTTLLTLVSFVGERTSGTLDRVMVSPLTESEIVVGYAAAFSVVGTMQSALLLIVGIIAFDITVVGNVLLAFVVIALLAIVSVSLGILLSSLAKREIQAIQFLPFIVLPALLLSGVFWPIEAIPSWLRPLSYVFPTTYAIDASRAVILKGWGLNQILIDILVLLVFITVFLALGMRSLQGRKQ